MVFSSLRPGVERLVLAWGIACLVAIPLAGCTEAVPPLEPVTITFACPDVDEEYYKELAQQFNEQYPHLTVELHSTGRDPLDDVNTGDVDVLVVAPWAVGELQAEGTLLNLDPFIEQDESFALSDFYPGTIELFTAEGRTWAVPGGVDVLVTFYNRDLFDQHNLPYPDVGWTLNDLLRSAVEIRDPDAGIYGYVTSGTTNEPSYFDAALLVYLHGGRLFDSLQAPTRTTFDDPLTVEALEWYADLYHEYDVAPTPKEARSTFGASEYAFYDGMRKGQVGMWFGGLSERGGMAWPVEWYINWGMAPLPRDAQLVTQADVEGYAIYAQTGYPDACWEWIKFLTRYMPSSAAQRLMPARRTLAESKAYEQLAGEQVARTARASMENAILINPRAFGEWENAMQVFAQAVAKVVNEEATPAEALGEAQRLAESARGQ